MGRAYLNFQNSGKIRVMDCSKQLRFDESKSVLFGDPIPLNLQVSDGRDDLQVFANIIAATGAGLARVRLNHFQGGFYASTSYPMPETDHIFAQYVIEKNGQPLTDYEIVSEMFLGIPRIEAPKWIIGWAMDETFAEGFIIGHENFEA